MLRNNPTKKQIDAEIQVTLKNAPAQKRTEEKMFYRLLQQIIKPNCKLTLIASENVFSINFCCFDYFNYCYCNPEIPVYLKVPSKEMHAQRQLLEVWTLNL